MERLQFTQLKINQPYLAPVVDCQQISPVHQNPPCLRSNYTAATTTLNGQRIVVKIIFQKQERKFYKINQNNSHGPTGMDAKSTKSVKL